MNQHGKYTVMDHLDLIDARLESVVGVYGFRYGMSVYVFKVVHKPFKLQEDLKNPQLSSILQI